jgi:hypothetical protein
MGASLLLAAGGLFALTSLAAQGLTAASLMQLALLTGAAAWVGVESVRMTRAASLDRLTRWLLAGSHWLAASGLVVLAGSGSLALVSTATALLGVAVVGFVGVTMMEVRLATLVRALVGATETRFMLSDIDAPSQLPALVASTGPSVTVFAIGSTDGTRGCTVHRAVARLPKNIEQAVSGLRRDRWIALAAALWLGAIGLAVGG